MKKYKLYILIVITIIFIAITMNIETALFVILLFLCILLSD